MFSSCNSLINLPENLLPQTDLSIGCYLSMFENCSNLIETCNLLAINIPVNGYKQMFSGCTKLQTVKTILAENIDATGCYNMFSNCTELRNTQHFKIRQVNESGCYHMFYSCTSLEEITFDNEILINNRLALSSMFESCLNLIHANITITKCEYYSCCNKMFYNCSKLIDGITIRTDNVAESACFRMFYACSELTNITCIIGTNLNIESRIDKSGCNEMFKNCTSLNCPISFNATVINDEACNSMFEGCSSFNGISSLRIKTIGYKGCSNMFYSCRELTECSVLPVENVGEEGCYSMFSGCSSLTICPDILPARVLQKNCYSGMFSYSAIRKSPKLPALELSYGCYSGMFSYCDQLTIAQEISARILAKDTNQFGENGKVSATEFYNNNSTIVIKTFFATDGKYENLNADNATEKTIGGQKGFVTEKDGEVLFDYLIDGKICEIVAPNEDTIGSLLKA